MKALFRIRDVLDLDGKTILEGEVISGSTIVGDIIIINNKQHVINCISFGGGHELPSGFTVYSGVGQNVVELEIGYVDYVIFNQDDEFHIRDLSEMRNDKLDIILDDTI